jgi:hypothetical protein
MKKVIISRVFLVIGLCFVLISCNEKQSNKVKDISKKETVLNKEVIDSCIKTRAIATASKIYKAGNIEDTFLSDKEFKDVLKSIDKYQSKIDSSSIYITNYDFQKEIFLNESCSKKVDGLGVELMKSFFVSDFIYDEIKFVKHYEKNILNFGKSLIYEFEIVGGSEYNPHYITLILDKNKSKGISINSDGIRWSKGKEEYWTPLFVERVRIQKQYEIALYYNGNGFVPLGHHKIPELWKED